MSLKEQLDETIDEYRLSLTSDIILKILEKYFDENMTEPYCKSRVKEMLK